MYHGRTFNRQNVVSRHRSYPLTKFSYWPFYQPKQLSQAMFLRIFRFFHNSNQFVDNSLTALESKSCLGLITTDVQCIRPLITFSTFIAFTGRNQIVRFESMNSHFLLYNNYSCHSVSIVMVKFTRLISSGNSIFILINEPQKCWTFLMPFVVASIVDGLEKTFFLVKFLRNSTSISQSFSRFLSIYCKFLFIFTECVGFFTFKLKNNVNGARSNI